MNHRPLILALGCLCTAQAFAQEGAPPRLPPQRVERGPVPATPMKRAERSTILRPTRITPEQYNAFAAEYQGNVKLFRLDESERTFNAALLAEVIETATAALRTNESATVKYYGGISHSLGGVMVHGHAYGKDPSVPLTNVYYHEFFEDRAGRVHTVVGNDVDGTRYVTDILLYDSGRLYARLAYNRAAQFQYVDLVYYRSDQPYVMCRVGRTATVTMELANAPPVAPESK